MNVTKVMTADGDIFFVDPWQEMKPELDMYIRRAEILPVIRVITDPAELPEYLSDEDPRVIEFAKLKLDELTESKGCLKQRS